MAEGRARGLTSGLGAALADGLYGVIAGFGLTFISGFLLSHQSLIRFLGGMFLCYLGLRNIFIKPANPTVNYSSTSDKGLLSACISTFFLTITNPLTIVLFTGIFAGLGIMDAGRNYALASVLVMGVFLGSALWWIILTMGTGILQAKLNFKKLQWINKVSGLIILGFGAIALISLI